MVAEIKVGDNIEMKSPNSMLGTVVCHITAIIPDPSKYKKENNIIVYRYWSKHRNCWYWKAHSYCELAILNGWVLDV